MEKQTQSEVTRSIDNRFGSISKTDRSNIEVNIIRWNNGRKKLDIRVWSSDGKCPKKGVTFSREEYYQLIRILTAIDPLLIDSGKAARTEPESRQKERAAAAEEQLAGYRSTMEAAFAEEDDYVELDGDAEPSGSEESHLEKNVPETAEASAAAS